MIGILGGTFNPIHNGHINVALEVKQQLGLSRVVFIPCADPPHRDTPLVDSATRYQMVSAALQAYDELIADDVEIRRGGVSYSVDTLEELRTRYPDTVFYFLMGSDAFMQFDSWREWQRILQLSHIVVMKRPGWDYVKLQNALSPQLREVFARHGVRSVGESKTQSAGKIIMAPVSPWEISSTQIRERIARGESIDEFVPAAVGQIIHERVLYQQPAALVHER